ncbi:MAG: hypothetical protein AB7G23_17275 [Vicinamibacterales bacterium]
MTGQQVTGACERGRKGLALTIVASVLLIAAGLHLWPLALPHRAPGPPSGSAVATGAPAPPSWERPLVPGGAGPDGVAPPAVRPDAAAGTGPVAGPALTAALTETPVRDDGPAHVVRLGASQAADSGQPRVTSGPPAVGLRAGELARHQASRPPRPRQPGPPTTGTMPTGGAVFEAALSEVAPTGGVSQPPALLAARDLVAVQDWAPVVVDATPWSSVGPTPPPAAGAVARAFSAAGQAVAKGFKATGGALRAAF